MRLTRHTDYGLRLLMYLALEASTSGGHASGPPRQVAQIARAFGVSAHHLSKVAQTLVRAGFLVAIRGRSGGFRLARPAAQIIVGDVVRATEPDFELADCFAGEDRCVVQSCCELSGVLEDARQAFMARLDAVTVERLVAAKQQMTIALRIDRTHT